MPDARDDAEPGAADDAGRVWVVVASGKAATRSRYVSGGGNNSDGFDAHTSAEVAGVDMHRVGLLTLNWEETKALRAVGHRPAASGLHRIGVAVRDRLLLPLAAIAVDEDKPVLLAGQVEPGIASLHSRSSVSHTGSGLTGEVPTRMLINGLSVGIRPVAAPGASHRGERQATRTVFRRRLPTSRRYESRGSAPAITACGRTPHQ